MTDHPDLPTWFDAVGDVLTRITLDLRSAVIYSDDNDARLRAFALVHLTRSTTEILAEAIWIGPERAGTNAAQNIIGRCRNRPEEFPEWLRLVVSGWQVRLASEPVRR